MLGFLSDGENQSLGFILLPNKKIYKITLGNYLGLEQGLVVDVYPNKIIIKNNRLNKIINLSIKLRNLTYDKNFS